MSASCAEYPAAAGGCPGRTPTVQAPGGKLFTSGRLPFHPGDARSTGRSRRRRTECTRWSRHGRRAPPGRDDTRHDGRRGEDHRSRSPGTRSRRAPSVGPLAPRARIPTEPRSTRSRPSTGRRRCCSTGSSRRSSSSSRRPSANGPWLSRRVSSVEDPLALHVDPAPREPLQQLVLGPRQASLRRALLGRPGDHVVDGDGHHDAYGGVGKARRLVGRLVARREPLGNERLDQSPQSLGCALEPDPHDARLPRDRGTPSWPGRAGRVAPPRPSRSRRSAGASSGRWRWSTGTDHLGLWPARRLDSLAPSAGFEPAHPAPEADALSPELRGRVPEL